MKSERTYLYLFSVFLTMVLVSLYILFTIQTYPYNYLYFMLTCFLLLFSFIRGLTGALFASLFLVFGHGTWILIRMYFMKNMADVGMNDVIWLLFFPLSAVLAGITGTHVQDLLKRHEHLEKNYSDLVMIDEITGLSNYRRFQADLDEEVSRSVRYGRPLVLLLVEIRYFVQLQKEYGKKATNQLLEDLTQGIIGATRDVDKKAYLGEGIFGLILPETRAQATDIIRTRLNESLSSHQIIKAQTKKNIHLALRFGLSSSPDEGDQAEVIYQKAREKLDKYVD